MITEEVVRACFDLFVLEIYYEYNQF
jgi:hypothetical protein